MAAAKLFINGEWIESEDSFISKSPVNGETIGKVYVGKEINVNSAIMAAHKAFPGWASKNPKDRALIIKKVSELILAQFGEGGQISQLKKIIMEEIGKPFPEAEIEVLETSDMLNYFADRYPTILKSRALELNKELWPTKKSHVYFEPRGVIGIIKPWNYPLEIPLWTIAPALIAGNTVVFKPSEYSSFVAQEIGKMFEAAGLPSGVFNIVNGDDQTGKLLVKNDNIDMIDFTGGVTGGSEVAIECGKLIRKYNLELGGNDAALVDSDVDIELAANGLVWGAFCNAGQVCVGVKRAFVDQKVFNELEKLIVEKTEKLRRGIDYGPIISASQLKDIEIFVQDAISKGAKALTGGKRIENEKGYYFEPTVLIDVIPSMKLMKEECFGPILPLVKISNIQQGIEMANNTEYGLGASVWTKDLEKGQKIAMSLQSGMVWINDVNVAFAEAPWGGRKKSGAGYALSEWSIFEFVNIKHLNIETSTSNCRDWWYPYSSFSS